MSPQQSPWRSFVSTGTLVTAALMVAVLGVEYGWAAGAWLVLLLYFHEIGHVLAALWRRVPVERAPTFIPGLGAFVVIRGARGSWNSVMVSAGGPVVGGLAAVAAKAAGAAAGSGALAFAGSFALAVNLLNLLPISMLDGGSILAGTGWVGALSGVALAAVGVWLGNTTLMVVGVVMAVWLATRPMAANRSLAESLHAALVHVGAGMGLILAQRLTGPVALIRARPNAFTSAVDVVIWICLGAYILSSMGWKTAWSPYTQPWYRYLFVGFLGWPNFLLRNPWMVPVPFMGLAQLLGLPGLSWLERFVRARAPHNDQAAGFACTVGYDVLQSRSGPGPAKEWLDTMLPVALAGGVWVTEAAAADLNRLGYHKACEEWRLAQANQGYAPESVPVLIANNIAWSLFQAGRLEEALPYARAATNTSDPKGAYFDTLGRILFESGQHQEAADVLRQSLDLENSTGTRVALARALAALGKFKEAIWQAQRALDAHKGPWPHDEPTALHVETWIKGWMDQQGAG